MKLTEKDKKLLYFLGWFLLIVVVGLMVIKPLLAENADISARLDEALIESDEKQMKVAGVIQAEAALDSITSQIDEEAKELYAVMPSTGVDQILTQMALSHNVTVNSLNIALPSDGAYVQLAPYMHRSVLTGADEGTGNGVGTQYAGVYETQIVMQMSGDREDLQAMLDECAGLEPKIRVAAFNWITTSKTSDRMTIVGGNGGTSSEEVSAEDETKAETNAETKDRSEEDYSETEAMQDTNESSREQNRNSNKKSDKKEITDKNNASDRGNDSSANAIYLTQYQLSVSLRMYMAEDKDMYMLRALTAASTDGE